MSPKLKDLLNRLDQFEGAVPPEQLHDALISSGLTIDDLAHWVKFCDEHYARNRIHIGPAYHALALCWKVGQHSVIHDHAGSGCGVLVVQGEGVETVYDRNEAGMLSERLTRVHKHGSVCVSVDADIHRLGNNRDDEDLVTLHIYSPPLLNWGVYTTDSTEVTWCQDEEFEPAVPACE